MTEELEIATGSTEQQIKKPAKRGIIYLSSIPPHMNVSQIREVFSEYGTLGRVYLQLANKEPKPGEKKESKRKVAKKFTEGWIEFERKSVAKKVAQLLNNTQVSTRKKSRHFDYIWNIKYLSNFKWTHLHERLAYEKAARRQKLRAEIQLAKKKASFFSSSIDKKKKLFDKKNSIVKKNVKSVSDTNNEDRSVFLKTLFK